MERRNLLKGLLGTGAGVVLGRKVLTVEEADKLNAGDTSPLIGKDSVFGFKNEEHTSAELLEPTYVNATTSSQPPLRTNYYSAGDQFIRLGTQSFIESGDTVALDKNLNVVKHNPEAPKSDPSRYPLGYAVETSFDSTPTQPFTVVVQVRTDSGAWTALE